MSGLTLTHKKAWEIAFSMWTAEKEMDRCRRPRGLLLRSEQARPTRRGRELHHRMLQVPIRPVITMRGCVWHLGMWMAYMLARRTSWLSYAKSYGKISTIATRDTIFILFSTMHFTSCRLDLVAFQGLRYITGRRNAAAELTKVTKHYLPHSVHAWPSNCMHVFQICNMLNNIERDKRTGVQWKYAGSKRTGKSSKVVLSCTYNESSHAAVH